MLQISDLLRNLTVDSHKEEPSDLKLFLKMISLLEEGTPNDRVNNFITMLKDPNRALISGSSVLAHRINKPEIANDIDIFIDGHEMAKVKYILQAMFERDIVEQYIWPVYRDLTKTSEDKDQFIREAVLTNTSSDKYTLIKLEAELKTYRIRLGKYIQLNFIILTENKINIDRNFISSAMYPFPNYVLNIITSRDFGSPSQQDVIFKKYRNLILEHIWRTFDFQELKWVWDFKANRPQDIYRAAHSTIDKILNDLSKIETSRELQDVVNIALRMSVLLNKRSEKFVADYNNLNIITISSQEDSDSFYNVIPDLNPKIAGHLFADYNYQRVFNFYEALLQRIIKYQTKGFEVNDPNHVMVDLQTAMSQLILTSLYFPDLDKVQRRSIFKGSRQAGERYLFLGKLKKLISDNRSELGLPDEFFDQQKRLTDSDKETSF